MPEYVLIPDRERLGDGETVVDGDDLSVDQDNVGGRGLRCRRRGAEQHHGKRWDQERAHGTSSRFFVEPMVTLVSGPDQRVP
jgi:hypothetical protein